MTMAPMLEVNGLTKVYKRGWPNARETFRLEADPV